MKIIFIPMDAYVHVNSCVGLAKQSMNYDNECIFIVPTNWTKAVEGHGFSIETVAAPGYEAGVDLQSGFASFMEDENNMYDMSPLEKFKILNVSIHDHFLNYSKQTDEQYEELLRKINPDLIIFDFWITVPAIVNSGIPYVLLWSCSPTLPYWKLNAPPYSSGLGITDGDEESRRFRDALNECLRDKKTQFDSYYMSKGLDPDCKGIALISREGKAEWSSADCRPLDNNHRR